MRAPALAALTVVALTVALLAAIAPTTSSIAEAAPSCRVSQPVTGTPVVLVHGWNSDADAMKPTAELLGDALPPTEYTFLRFDYRDGSTTWPDDTSGTPQCLADYLVSAWKKAGGHQKVVVVGHSLGGIAARFASVKESQGVAVRDVMSGLVTLSTPHLGSPWGNTEFAETIEGWREGGAIPVRKGGSPARECLAAPETAQQSGCAVAPYLPDGIRVDQIGTQTTIRRSLFRLGAFSAGPSAALSVWGDGIVTDASADGYQNSVPGTLPARTRGAITTVPCTVDTDSLLAQRWGPHADPVGDRAPDPGALWLDRDALDDLAAQRPTARTLELAAYTLMTPCSHLPRAPFTEGMVTEPRVVAAIVDAIRNAGNPSSTSETLRPVDATSGWSAGGPPVPAGFAGTWRGLVTQTGRNAQRYVVQLTLTEGSGTGPVRYEELRCSGTLQLNSVDADGGLGFTQTIDKTVGRCEMVVPISLRFDGTGSALSYAFRGKESAGTATLRRV